MRRIKVPGIENVPVNAYLMSSGFQKGPDSERKPRTAEYQDVRPLPRALQNTATTFPDNTLINDRRSAAIAAENEARMFRASSVQMPGSS